MKTNLLLCGLASVLTAATGALAADDGGAPVTRRPSAAGDGVEVGVARRDGVTVSGGEAFVTRNGVTEKLAKDLELPSGIIVSPDGSLKLGNRSETTLQADQLLTLDGRVVTIPHDPNVNPALPAQTAQVQASGAGSSDSTMRIGPASGSVFLSGNGTPFMGTVTSPGVITTSDNIIIPIDGSFRAVSFGAGGVPSIGRLNANGTITTASGTTVYPDGSVRAPNGTFISSATPGMGAAVAPNMLSSLGLAAPQGTATTTGTGTTGTTGTTQQGNAVQPNGTTQNNGVTNGQGTNGQATTNGVNGTTQQGVANPAATTTQGVVTPQSTTTQQGTTTGTQGTAPQPGTMNQSRTTSPNGTTGGRGTTAPSGTMNSSAGGAVNGGAGAGQGAHGGGGAR